MDDYKKMYYTLFNAITSAIKILQQAQIDTEAMFLTADDDCKIVQLDEIRNEDNTQE